MGKYKDNPWLGLESYQECQIIYGRNTEIEELSLCILNNNDTVLYGKSGIGKSSIINAGIMPILRQHGYFPIVVRLDHSNVHSYIKQLSDLIEKTVPVSDCTIVKPVEEQVLWEYFHTHKFNKITDEKSKLVIIFDQFEEIFTLQNDNAIKGQFFKELGNVLNNVMPKGLIEETQPFKPEAPQSKEVKQEFVSGFADMADLLPSLSANVNNTKNKYIEDNDIHFVFTLREDFLSEFEYHTSKIPSLKQHRYGLRPLNEEQAAEIIMKPRPGLVDEAVARLIIETITNRTDFSLGDEPEIDVDAAVLSLFLNQIYDKRPSEQSPISIDLIKTFGKDIIMDFYVEAIEGLSACQIDFLEEELLTGENRRDSLSKSDFKAGGFSDAELKRLIYDKKILRQFHYEGDLRVEFIHDILCPVVKERKEKRQQENERKRQEEEKRRIQEEAKRKQREIEEKAEREIAEIEAESIRVKRRNRKRLITLSSFLAFIALITLAMGTYYYCFEYPYSEVYGNFTTRNGWPIGLGEQLSSSEEKEKCTVYYKLTRNGRLPSFMGESRPFTKVEILNWKGEPTTNVFMESPVVRIIDKELYDTKAAEFAKLLSRVSYWQYTPDANGLISKKTAFDINKKELYSESYSSIDNIGQSSKHILWSVFYDEKGNPLQISDNGTDRIRYTVSEGYITGCSFFTVLGTPQPNTSGDYGYRYEIDSKSANITSTCNLDKFGDKIDSTLIHFSSFENGRYTKSDICSVEYSKQNVIRKCKGYNDTIHFSEKGFADFISVATNNSDRVSVKYKAQDVVLAQKRFNNDTLVYSENHFYSSNLDSIRFFDIDRDPNVYTIKYSYPNKNTTEKSYWSNGKKIEFSISLDLDEIKCHKIITKTTVQNSDSTITTSYYDCTNALTKTGPYSKSEKIYNANSGYVMYEYYYGPDEEICKSEMFTYDEYGVKESRAVAGIDKTPVRCPNWDADGLAYYRMAFIKDFVIDRFVSIKGINEFGDDSYIIWKDSSMYTISESLPTMKTTPVENVTKSNIYSISFAQNYLEPIKRKINIPFIHILNKKSIFYNAKGHQVVSQRRDGIFDNDIPYKVGKWTLGASPELLNEEISKIEKNGGVIKVLRCFNNEYNALSFSVPAGVLYAEIHDIYLTDKEYKRIKKYLR